jgi:hypothetical protein
MPRDLAYWTERFGDAPRKERVVPKDRVRKDTEETRSAKRSEALRARKASRIEQGAIRALQGGSND